MLKHDFCRGWYLSSNEVNANVVFSDLDLNCRGQSFQLAILTSKRWKMLTLLLPSYWKSPAFLCVGNFPSNCATANVVYHDLDLYFQGHEFWNVNISKTVRASEKFSSMIFIEVDICHRMGPLWMLYSATLTFIFKVTHYIVMHLLWKKSTRQRMSLADLPRRARPPAAELLSFDI